MTLALSPEIQKLIDDRVRSGRYASAEDVVAAALFQMDQNDRLAELSPEELELVFPGIKQKLAEGLADAKAGRLTDGDAFYAELKRELQDRSRTPATRR